jgi:hypothetical protein
MMGDDVMELARDPGALPLDREPGEIVPLGFELAGAAPQRVEQPLP